MQELPAYIHFSKNPDETLKELIITDSPDKVAVLVDENSEQHCLPKINNLDVDVIIKIKSGEENKNLDTCKIIWDTLTEGGFTRQSLLINLGGGVIGDMGGFAASTFKRGIRFYNVPTTLLSQVDASIGGKLGIDFEGLKNHIGVFKTPDAVVLWEGFLETLDPRELKSGFAEVIKHGLIWDKTYWNKIQSIDFKGNINWAEINKTSVEIKNSVVGKDPYELGLRKILNFGHTLGHAIETFFMMNNDRLLHGEAIACGMILESYLSMKIGLLAKNELNEITEYLFNIYPKVILPDMAELKPLLFHDKKNVANQINFSLIDKIGSCTYDKKIEERFIAEAIAYYADF